MNAVLMFKSVDESNQFFKYVMENTSRFRELYAQQRDADLPCFPVIQGLNVDKYKNDYRDALVLQKMLLEFRNQPTVSMILEGSTHADT